MKTNYFNETARVEIKHLLAAHKPTQLSLVFTSQNAMAAFASELTELIGIAPLKQSPMMQLFNRGETDSFCYITWELPSKNFAKNIGQIVRINGLQLMANWFKETIADDGWLKKAMLFINGEHLPLSSTTHPATSLHEQTDTKSELTRVAIQNLHSLKAARNKVALLFVDAGQADLNFFAELVEQIKTFATEQVSLPQEFSVLVDEVISLMQKEPTFNKSRDVEFEQTTLNLIKERLIGLHHNDEAAMDQLEQVLDLELEAGPIPFYPDAHFLSPGAQTTLRDTFITDEQWASFAKSIHGIEFNNNEFSEPSDDNSRLAQLTSTIQQAKALSNSHQRIRELVVIADDIGQAPLSRTVSALLEFGTTK